MDIGGELFYSENIKVSRVHLIFTYNKWLFEKVTFTILMCQW